MKPFPRIEKVTYGLKGFPDCPKRKVSIRAYEPKVTARKCHLGESSHQHQNIGPSHDYGFIEDK